ncbi:MAG: NADH:flavin oxidoreductase [Deltaproteobacteria bacterium]|nr:NADH:flavin oxidoreductase [Deltaproteobacteria bacterium]
MSDVFAPATLGPLRLQSRVIKAATFEGMSPRGVATEELVTLHERLAKNGVGLTTVAYCAVDDHGRTFTNQLGLGESSREVLRGLVRRVHDAGGAVSIQLGHAGFFSKVRGSDGRGPRGPSFALNAYGVSSGLPFARAMTERDIEDVLAAFGRAAEIVCELGFDAVEVHLGHGYLLSQFLSPATNRRDDAWGGEPERRRALPLAVLARVRRAVGRERVVIAKNNLSDGFTGGLEIEESIEIARAIERSGDVDLIVPSGGFTSRTPFFLLRGGLPLARMAAAQDDPLARVSMRVLGGAILDRYDFEEAFFRPLALRLRAAVSMPIALLGGLVSKVEIERVRTDGFDFAVLGRALLADPDLVVRMRDGELERSRCNACNECIAEMDLGGLRCVLDGPRAA